MSGTPLPPGSVLLHIGPHKTGTTTLQAAFHASREAMAEQGVHYAGENAHAMVAAMAAARRVLPTLPGLAERQWQALTEEVTSCQASRVVVSSEFFADAPAGRVQPIIDELGGAPVHVVVTLRSLVRILPSQWQQYVQNRKDFAYADWLNEMLNVADTTLTPTFWARHRHDRLVQRWAEAVGVDRLTVVVVDEHDKGRLVSDFEDLLDLRRGTLRSPGVANRSLTYAEVETLRAFNRRWRSQAWSPADYTRLVRFGAARHMQARPDTGRPVMTPQWAVDRAVEIQQDMVKAIAGLGVAVIGDLDALPDADLARDVGDNPPSDRVPPDVVVSLAAGLVRSVLDVPRRPPAGDRVVGELEAAARARPGRPRRPAAEATPQGPLRRVRRALGRVRRAARTRRRMGRRAGQ